MHERQISFPSFACITRVTLFLHSSPPFSPRVLSLLISGKFSEIRQVLYVSVYFSTSLLSPHPAFSLSPDFRTEVNSPLIPDDKEGLRHEKATLFLPLSPLLLHWSLPVGVCGMRRPSMEDM
uniref:Uncharacterized protein n=1 Tax=Nelumbo nucifera TaxID=4432 RepID=A0A822ZTF4_NELNU|nr:TPA_asm: hypothetical protein HUJ06_003378 [Nelumbo nucifera]